LRSRELKLIAAPWDSAEAGFQRVGSIPAANPNVDTGRVLAAVPATPLTDFASNACALDLDDARYDARDNFFEGGFMTSRVRGFAAGIMLVGGAMLSAPAAHAGQVVNEPRIPAPAPAPQPVVQMFDCQGSTGDHGCGAGFFWRDGWHGFGCYPC
jgi:hypothetical protein